MARNRYSVQRVEIEILKGMNFLKGDTTRERNEQIGSRRAEKDDLKAEKAQRESVPENDATPKEGGPNG